MAVPLVRAKQLNPLGATRCYYMINMMGMKGSSYRVPEIGSWMRCWKGRDHLGSA
jgi:hypothetical protein